MSQHNNGVHVMYKPQLRNKFGIGYMVALRVFVGGTGNNKYTLGKG
jgi:hypothetical protein